MSDIQYSFRWIDGLEHQYKVLHPFIRVTSAYAQAWGAIAIVAVLVGAVVLIVTTIISFSIQQNDPEILQFIKFVAWLAVVSTAVIATTFCLVDAVASRVGMLAIVFYSILLVAALIGLLASIYVLDAIMALSTIPVPPFSTLFQGFLFVTLSVAGVLWFLFFAYLVKALFQAVVSAVRLSQHDREILRSLYGGVGWFGKLWHRLRSVPPLFEFVAERRALAIGVAVLGGISALCLAYATLALASGPITLVSSFDIAFARCIPAREQLDPQYVFSYERCATGIILWAVASFFILPPVLLWIGGWLQHGVRRLVRLSLGELQRIDPRPPILFLRAFADDQISLQAPQSTWLGWIVDIGRPPTNLDQMLLEEATQYGPVVALGKPGDPYPPYGAARGYFDNKDWQEAVTELAASAKAIIVCFNNTPNIWWEIEHLVAQGHLSKCLVLLHPNQRNTLQQTNLASELLAKLKLPETEVQSVRAARTMLGLFHDSADVPQVALSSTFSRSAFLLTVRWFLRSKFGVKSVPLPPKDLVLTAQTRGCEGAHARRWTRAIVIMSWLAGAAVVAGALYFADVARREASIAKISADVGTLHGHVGRVWSAAFSPNGMQIVTASEDGTARVWDAITLRELVVLRGHKREVRTAAFSPNGMQIVTAAQDGTARIWNAANGTQTAMLPIDDLSPLAAFSSDGTRIVAKTPYSFVTQERSKLVLWNPETGNQMEIRTEEVHVRSAAFSQDGSRIVTAAYYPYGSTEHEAVIWDAVTLKLLTNLRGHSGALWSAAYSPDGSRIVTASVDRTARIWDAARAEAITVLRGHKAGVSSAAFSPDGSQVVTASSDGTAGIWNATRGNQIAALQAQPQHQMHSAAFSPDGTRVVTASSDSTARIWDVRNLKTQ